MTDAPGRARGRAVRPPASYRLASLALALPYAVYTWRRARRDGGRSYHRGRYGRVEAAATAPLWIHCASVGEVAAAEPLLHELQAHGLGPLLVTTATPTGQTRARQRVPPGATVAYLPLDRPRPVRRFLDTAAPRVALILETELWPWLYAGLAERAIPIALVNARLSPRTLGAPRWWRRVAGWCLRQASCILARSPEDRDRLLALGAPVARVEVIGNLKFAAVSGPAPAPIGPDAAFVLAASTHDDEELQLARAWRTLGAPGHALVLAPRHPERGAAIARSLESAGFAVHRRSRGEWPAAPALGPDGPIHLADTLGELPGLIAGARVVIMGGSLIARGGQNLLEPARLARAIVTGPHMDNFAAETAALAAADGLIRADDATDAVRQAAALLADPVRRGALADNARTVIARNADMATRYRLALAAALPAITSR